MGPNNNSEDDQHKSINIMEASGTDGEGVGEWRVTDLLAAKIRGDNLTDEQVSFLVQKVTDGSMDDCQLGKDKFGLCYPLIHPFFSYFVSIFLKYICFVFRNGVIFKVYSFIHWRERKRERERKKKSIHLCIPIN